MGWTPLPDKVELTFHPPKPVAFTLKPEKSALVIVDMQNRFCKTTDNRCADSIEGNVRLLKKARAAGVKVIYIQSVRSPEGLEFTKFGRPHALIEGTPETEIVEELTPLPTETVIKKRSHDPFARTELEGVLRGEHIIPTDTTVIVTGVSGAVCANAAVLGFSNRHYMTLVPMDCQAAGSVEEEARTYDHYIHNGYVYDTAFTLSDMIEFSPEGMTTAEIVAAKQY